MSQVQNHRTKETRLYNQSASPLTKDKAVVEVTVMVDTSQWSKRKMNIITESLRSGVAACGWETAEIVNALAASVGSNVNSISQHRNFVRAHEVILERLDALLAYTAAWVRLEKANNPALYSGSYSWGRRIERHMLECLDRGDPIDTIPMNNSMTYNEKREFIHEYLIASEDREQSELLELIGKIERGQPVAVTYTK